VGADFHAALAFYHNVQAAVKDDIPGAKAICEDLKTRFPGSRRKGGAAEEAFNVSFGVPNLDGEVRNVQNEAFNVQGEVFCFKEDVFNVSFGVPNLERELQNVFFKRFRTSQARFLRYNETFFASMRTF
jgi:hypothetical protein